MTTLHPGALEHFRFTCRHLNNVRVAFTATMNEDLFLGAPAEEKATRLPEYGA
jgi:hypothetical protein